MAKPTLDQLARQSLDSIAQQSTQTTPKQSLDQLAQQIVKPQKTTSQITQDVGEGVVGFAGHIFKPIAETGLLDKPMEYLGRGVGNVARALGLNVASKETIEQRLKSNPFSKEAAGSQVGGDPNSRLAKGVETGLGIAEMVAGIPTIIKGAIKTTGIKTLAKEVAEGGVKEKTIKKAGAGKILDIIRETESASDKRQALRFGNIKDQPSGFKKRLSGGGEVVKPSQRTLDAVGTIKQEIKKASKKPVELYNQVVSRGEELAKDLGGKLKDVKIGTMTKVNAGVKNALKDIATEAEGYSPTIVKEIKRAINTVSKAKNLDDVRSARKTLDKMMPDSVKSGLGDGKSEILNKLWKVARNNLNDYMDEVADTAGDVAVKKQFKIMSNLKHAEDQIYEKIPQLTKASKGVLSRMKKGGKALLKTAAIGAAGALGFKALGGKGGGGGTYSQE